MGQALVELVVILPVLILFMATVAPMLTIGTTVPWLDERLFLRQLGDDIAHIHSLLLTTHESELIPSYFETNHLEETTHDYSMETPMNIPGLVFPGALTRKTIIFTKPENGWWDSMFLKNQGEKGRQIIRSLAIVAAPVIPESRVVEKVRRLSIGGALPVPIRILKKIGIKPFHLNLDALPRAESKGK